MPLDYSPQGRIRWYDRRWFHRALWGAMVLCMAPFAAGLLYVAWGAAARAWNASRNRALLNQSMTYRAAADQVVFEMNAGTANVVLAAPPWARWWKWPTRPYPTVFLHERHDAAPTFASPTQLVAVELETQLRNTYDGRTILDRPLLVFEPWQVYPGNSPGSASQVFGSTKLVILPEPTDRVRVFAGQPDPSDASAFTFDVEYNGVRQSVRGRLSGNLVTLAPAAGTSLSPAAWRHATFWLPAGSTPEQAASTAAVAASAGQPSPMTWPRTPFGQAFAAAPGKQ
jgi:hypothetical protein